MRHAAGISVIFLLLGLAPPARAADAGKLKREAETAYYRAHYKDAIVLLERLVALEGSSAAIHYNLGNAYYKNGQVGPSILNYHRAKLLDPGDRRISDNIAVAELRVKNRPEPMPLLFAVRWWNDLKSARSVRGLLVISSLLLWGVMAAVFVFFGYTRVLARRLALLAGGLLFLAFAASVFLALDKIEDLEARRSAVVMAREAALRSAPDASGIETLRVSEGVVLQLEETRGPWHKARLADGTEGWIAADAVERI